jgi:serine/threonine-protein kinase
VVDTALGANYTLLERHGRGAMGEVWVAEDRRTGERVAAKILHAELAGDAELVGRFVRERSILTGLRHPQVVTVRDLVVEGDRLAIVMDLVDGGTLRDVLQERGTLPAQEAVAITAAVASGLAAAHAQQVVHRDIKPDNVLLQRDRESWGEDGALRLSDFGISRIVEGSTPATRGLLGTPEYIAPEVLVTGHADLPTDVYALGVLLYELLAGRTPFAGPGTDYTVAHRHVSNQVPALDVPEPVSSLLSDLLSKDPAARPSAATAHRRLAALVPTLAGVAALPAQAAPESFAAEERPATVVKARPTDPLPAEELPTLSPEDHRPVDLGPSGSETIVRAQPVRPAPAPRRSEETARTERAARPAWRDPRLLGIFAAGVALIGVAVFVVTRGGGDDGPAAAAGGPVQATQQDQPLPTGLGIQRAATYDAESGVAEVTITYSAQAGALSGPFLEVLPAAGRGGDCAQITWPEGEQDRNLPTSTGVTVDCGWAVDPGPVAARDAVQVRAEVQLDLAEPTAEALQQWLDGAAGTTGSATDDPQVSSSSYPAQRLKEVQVVAPSSVPVGDPVDLVLLPVWPSGPDELNPMFRSPAGAGDPSDVLVGVAGGDDGVRFVDGCSGALAVSSDRRTVTARSAADDCRVDARVGNFADLASNDFSVVARSDG